jgi:uncharacterized membrane protein
MEKKILFGFFVSLFLISLVSASLTITAENLGLVDSGDEVEFDILLNNSDDEFNSYTINISKDKITVDQNIFVEAGKSAVFQGTYTIPSGTPGIKTLNVGYNGSNQDNTPVSGTFTITYNLSESPSVSITKVQELTYTQNGVVRVENTGNVKLDEIRLSSSGNAQVTFSENNFSLNAGSSKTVEVSATNLNDLRFGNNAITITASSDGESDSVSFNLQQTFCVLGEQGGNLSIRDVKIESDGDKDDEWKFLDTITIEVEVENENSQDDVDEVFVELGLFDSSGNNVIDDFDFLSEDEERIDLGDLNDDDKETVTFEFRVPADFEPGNYKLAVKAYSDDLQESNECDDSSSDLSDTIYESISVEEEDEEGKFIGFDDVEISTSQFSCSESGSISFEVFNIGDEDQDRVLIRLINEALNIEEEYEIRSGLDIGDSETATVRFTLPSNAKDGDYTLYLDAEYDYNNGNYRQQLDDPEEIFIEVIGCSVPSTSNVVSISTDYSDAKAGSEFTIEAVIRNLADEEKTFLIDVDDYSTWAELVDISERSITLDAGDSETIEITLKVNKDASSQERLTLSAISDGETDSVRVDVDIEGSQGFSLGGNSMIWVIGLVNLILIILIIIVAVRLSRR